MEEDDAVVLVPSMAAIKMCLQDGEYIRVLPSEALWLFDALGPRRRAEIRNFIADARLSSFPLYRVDDEALFTLVRTCIRGGRLVGLRKDPKASKKAPSATTQQRLLVRKIETSTRDRLSYAGRQYKLVVDVDLGRVPNRDSYEVASHDEAKRVLDSLAKESGTQADLATLLGEASAKLTPDWYPPSDPDGLILLRRIIERAAASKSDEPAITPSQMRALMEKAALEIHVVDLKQKPQEGLAFKISMPDGGTASGKLDKEGRGRAKSSSSGVFTVTFPDLDGADWDGDGALDLPPEEERSEASTYEVEQGDRLLTIAREKGFARWQTIWNFASNAELKGLRGTGHILLPKDKVAIPTKVERKAEVAGGTAEYVVQCAAEVLRVCFADNTSSEDDSITFKAMPDTGDVIEGALSEDGTLEIDLPPDTSKVHVELFREEPDDEEESSGGEASDGNGGNDESDGADQGGEQKPFESYDFNLGELDPATEISGIQARLLNLGLYNGEINGTLDDDTREAISNFRWIELRDRKEDIDAVLLKALRKVHGS